MDASEEDNLAVLYTLQIGRLFCSIGLLEQATVSLLFIVESIPDGGLMAKKHQNLKNSTFGQLVARLEKNGVKGRALTYLKTVNFLRNDVVHGFFWEFPFPGDPQIDAIWLEGAIDHLERLQMHFRFAELHLSSILIRSGCVDVVYLGEAGRIISPRDHGC